MGSIFKAYKQPVRYIPKKAQHEANLQKEVCRFIRIQYPGIIFRSDYSSGLKLTVNQAAVHKSLQSSRAWPDLFIVHPSRGKAGLLLELKKEGTKIHAVREATKLKYGGYADEHIQEQAMMLTRLNELGYMALFGIGFDDSIEKIRWFMNPDYKRQENGTLF
jgi:hypothetical protein